MAETKKQRKSSNWNKEGQRLRIDLSSQAGRQRFFAELASRTVLIVVFVCVAVLVFSYFRWIRPLWAEMLGAQTLCSRLLVIVSIPESSIREWTELNIKRDLEAINPFEIQRTLEARGAVAEAKVVKDFPNHLHIDIRERIPVLLLATMNPEGKVKFWAIDASGIVFDPHDLAGIQKMVFRSERRSIGIG
jgi:cell division septal protein FtsQ